MRFFGTCTEKSKRSKAYCATTHPLKHKHCHNNPSFHSPDFSHHYLKIVRLSLPDAATRCSTIPHTLKVIRETIPGFWWLRGARWDLDYKHSFSEYCKYWRECKINKNVRDSRKTRNPFGTDWKSV